MPWACWHLGQRLDPVAQHGGAFEFHRLRSCLHFGSQVFLHLGRAAGEEVRGIGDQRTIVLFRNAVHTGPRTALDLIKQTGPRAAVKHGIRAVAQQEDLLQLVQRAIHRISAGKGAIIRPLFLLRTAMFLDLRKRVPGDQDIWKALVVAQKHIEMRLQLLDQVLLQQQRLGLGPRGQEHH